MAERALNADEAARVLDAIHLVDEAEPRSAIPERIGRYRILGELGSGGMARVFVAEQASPRRRVALKVLNIAAADGAATRLQTEAEVLADLSHPSIATVHEFGIWREAGQLTPYIAMELVPGARSVIAHATENGLALRDRLELMAEVCGALQHAHQRGVIHRDLKPENILVGEDGRPRVIDFGIARLMREDHGLTIDRQVLGTPHYVSPEQIVNGSSAADVRSDIYALGCVLYELLCGKKVWSEAGDSLAAVVRAALRTEPPAPRSVDASIPKDVEAVILKAISREPAERYQSAHELTEELRRCLRGEPVTARRPGAWTRSMRWLGRHPIVGTVAACCVIASSSLGLTFGAVWWLNMVPHSVEIDSADPRSVLIYARSGAVIERLGFGSAVHSADLFTGGEGIPGRRLIVVGLSRASEPDGTPLLEVRELNRRGRAKIDRGWAWRPAYPMWSAAERPGEDRVSLFRSNMIAFERVFPDDPTPGPQIVSIARHLPFSPSAIAVHALDGRLLHKVWHDGDLQGLKWLPNQGHFIVVGLNSEVQWSDRERAIPFSIDSGSPCVVFAHKPEFDRVTGLIRPGCPRADVEPMWYKALLLSEAGLALPRGLDISVSWSYLRSDLPRISVAGQVAESTAGSPIRYGWTWQVSAEGDIAPHFENDTTVIARQFDPRLPTIDQLYWGDLPPV